jgi:hypothetical protein
VKKQRSQYVLKTIALGFLVSAAIGCAANVPEARDARAAGVWEARLPTTPSTFGKLAYGSGGSSEPARIVEADAQPMLATAAPVTKHVRRASHPEKTPVAPAMAAKSDEPESLPAAKVTAPEAPVMLASNTDGAAQSRYAEREAATPKLQEYRGGDAIIISASALVIVLLIVVLILLLR